MRTGPATFARKIAIAENNVARYREQFLKAASDYAQDPTAEKLMELNHVAYQLNFHVVGLQEWIDLRDNKD